MRARRARNRRAERGVTLIETLGAFLILFVVTLAVLQLFSMATAVNMGSLARTDLSYRAERVLEQVRMQDALSRMTSPATTNACCPLTTGTYTLPVDAASCKDYWGAKGANAWEDNAPYTISYSVNTAVTGEREIVVVARPRSGGSSGYIGAVNLTKAVRYVAFLRPAST